MPVDVDRHWLNFSLIFLADNVFALQKWCSSKFPEAREKLDELYNEVSQ
jgi:hypothetical protein